MTPRPLNFIALFMATAMLSVSTLSAAPPQKQPPATSLKLTKPPKELDPFYKKHVSAGGLPVVGSEKVSDYALLEAAYLMNLMLEGREDIRQAMIKNKVRFSVMAYSERTSQIPEHSDLKPNKFWDRRARGLGATPQRPAVSCGEENLLAYPGDPYAAENILIHEFAHAIHHMGLNTVDPTFDERLHRVFKSAMNQGLWKGKYASNNRAEYWAEGVQSWFDTNRKPDHDHNHVDTREELEEYDPQLSKLIVEIFGRPKWRYVHPTKRTEKGHLANYDPSKAPTFAWSKELQQWYDAYQAKQKQAKADKEKKASQDAPDKKSEDKTSPSNDPETGGTVHGQVFYQADPKRRWRYARYYIADAKQGTLAEAVVAVESKALQNYPRPNRGKTVLIDQKDFRFAPETIAIRAGDRVKFTNSDTQVHNVYTRHPRDPFDESISSGEMFYHRFGRAVGMRRPVVLGCRFHSTMKAWIFVLGHPFYQATKADGQFRLENIPPGEYQLEMRHPAGNLRWSQKITITTGQTLKIDIRVSPDHLAK